MPKISIRRRRAQGGCLTFAIGVLAVTALALIAAIVITSRPGGGQSPAPGDIGGSGQYVDINDPSSQRELVLKADNYTGAPDAKPTAIPAATVAPTPQPTPEPTYNPDDPYALVRPQPMGEGYLPVFTKANTEARQIAITLDECSGATITQTFVEAALTYGARLTLFPTGENVMKKGMDALLRTCVNQLGFEIENRCYSTTARLYQLNNTMMATEIWKQSIAVSYVLGVKYEPHFLRLYGGDGENDLRTHTYLKQEGYLGIAGWTINGARMDEAYIGNNLAPGNIYYFKTTEDDLRMMRLLMQEASEQGYQMVTLNTLFGYEPNAMTRVNGSILSETLPELRDVNIPYYFMKPGDCTWATMLLQRRLTYLGYMEEKSADGVYGSGTAAALSAFQARCGLAATGAADVSTQKVLFSEDAPPQAQGA